MDSYAVFVVNEHLEMLRREAAERRAATEGRPGVIAQVRSRVTDLRRAIATSDGRSGSIVPRLEGYPYRG